MEKKQLQVSVTEEQEREIRRLFEQNQWTYDGGKIKIFVKHFQLNFQYNSYLEIH
jgi:hypothetical protein